MAATPAEALRAAIAAHAAMTAASRAEADRIAAERDAEHAKTVAEQGLSTPSASTRP